MASPALVYMPVMMMMMVGFCAFSCRWFENDFFNFCSACLTRCVCAFCVLFFQRTENEPSFVPASQLSSCDWRIVFRGSERAEEGAREEERASFELLGCGPA